MSRGTEEQFQTIVYELSKHVKNYEEKKIKHYQYADGVDGIFSSYGWSKAEFNKEVNIRLGNHTNETREKKKSPPPKKKVAEKKERPRSQTLVFGDNPERD